MTRDWTPATCVGSSATQPLDHQGSPQNKLKKKTKTQNKLFFFHPPAHSQCLWICQCCFNTSTFNSSFTALNTSSSLPSVLAPCLPSISLRRSSLPEAPPCPWLSAEQLFLAPPASQEEPSQALCVTRASRIPRSSLILLLNSFPALTTLWTSYLFISMFACLCFISSNCRTTYWRTRLWLLAAVSQGRGTKGFRGKRVGRMHTGLLPAFPLLCSVCTEKKAVNFFFTGWPPISFAFK